MKNARRFIASRDVPLPFSIPELGLEGSSPAGGSSVLDYTRAGERRSLRKDPTLDIAISLEV